MPLKAVFFDLDGTLLDTAPDLSAALNTLLMETQRPPLDYQLTRPVVSDGARALIEVGFNIAIDDPTYPDLRQRLLDHYSENLASQTQPFSGIEDLLSKLTSHNIAWGIVTNKPWAYTEPLMANFCFPSPPQVQICPDHVTHTKPHPEPLWLACKQVGCTVEEAIYIGDHRRDIEAGNRAGMATIAVGYGYIRTGDDHKTWEATHVAATGSELWPIIQNYLDL